jgi:hypothetical protein
MLWPLRSPKMLPQNKTGYVLQYIVTQDITVNIADKNLLFTDKKEKCLPDGCVGKLIVTMGNNCCS